jgi:deazaflavin-dependent oxidoreductase (nitroreductase family)
LEQRVICRRVEAMNVEYIATGPFRRVLRQAVTSRPVAVLSSRLLPRVDLLVLRLSSGRRTFSGWLTGLPVVQLGTTGARSGGRRTSPVMAVPDKETLLIAAANFGGERHPGWCHNIRANPDVTITSGDGTECYRARELKGVERDRAFARLLEFNPGWLRFRRRAGGRVIPVFRLAPGGGPGAAGG